MSAEKAHAWIRKAEHDLLSADNNLASARIPFDVVCYHSQQATEKYPKALTVYLGTEPARIHDLLALLEEVRKYMAAPIPDDVESSCVILNPYAVEIRYPDDRSDPTLEDSREARRAAEVVGSWVRNLIRPELPAESTLESSTPIDSGEKTEADST